MPIFVLDMNFLQTEELKERLQSDLTTRYVLPDVALVEMCKNADWQLTMKLATGVLYNHTERLKVSLSVGEALTIELRRLVPLRGEDFLSDSFAKKVAYLIQTLNEDHSKIDTELETEMTAAREALLKEELNADEAKTRTKTLLELLNKGLNPAVIKALRAPGLKHESLIAFAYETAHAYSWHLLTTKHGMPDSDAIEYLDLRPLILRYQFLLVRNCFVHIRNGIDIASYKASNELNNQLDLDFALIASYFDDLLSKDLNLVKSYADLKCVIKTQRSELTMAANAWLIELGLINSDGSIV